MYSFFERMKRDKKCGFTLVELLVVIVVLAVLAAIVLPKFMNSSTRSRESALKSDLKLLRLIQAHIQKLSMTSLRPARLRKALIRREMKSTLSLQIGMGHIFRIFQTTLYLAQHLLIQQPHLTSVR